MKSISGTSDAARCAALAGILLLAALASVACRASSAPTTPGDAPCVSTEASSDDDHHHDHGDRAGRANHDAPRAAVVNHAELTAYEHQGNELLGIATRSLGAREHEVWRSRVAVGSRTPLHTHEGEEIFVFLRGRGRARIGDETFEFVAPATVIAPAGVPHQFFNTGDEETEAIVIVGVGSQINDEAGAPLDLPWRR